MADAKTQSDSKTVSIYECKIISSNGEVIDLVNPNSFSLVNIQLYEDIYSPVIHGYAKIVDGSGAYLFLNMHGNEYLSLSFGRPGEVGDQKYKRTFRIYSCENKKQKGDSQTQTYIIAFCSDEAIFSNQQTISRAFEGAHPGTYIINVLLNDLKINIARISPLLRQLASKQPANICDYVLTKYKPFEAIEFFAKNSLNENGSPFIFFENRNGYNFISLENLFSQPSAGVLTHSSAKFSLSPEDAPFDSSMISHEYKWTFDVLDGTKNAYYADTLYTLDLIRQKFTKQEVSFKNFRSIDSLIDGFFPDNGAKNRNNKSLSQEFNAQPKYQLTNYGQTDTPYFISKRVRVNNTNVENTLIQRKMHLQMLENTRLWVHIPGNPYYTVGQVTEVDMPLFVQNDESAKGRKKDDFLGGKYLVTKLRHSITPDSMETFMLLSKNSIGVAMPAAAINNQSYNLARDY